MFLVSSYSVAVLLCVITMFCWGSWANTQKLAGRTWRFELYYWDYVIGVLLMSLVFAFTLGSSGEGGRAFLEDLRGAASGNLLSAAIGGVVFNAANLLLVAAIAVAGMSVAFPVGIGLALVLGVLVNYWSAPAGSAVLLFAGVGLVVLAMIFCARAYSMLPTNQSSGGSRGLLLAAAAGVLMGFFYRFVAASMASDFSAMEPGKLSPYTAMVFFSVGVFLSTFVFNTAIQLRPFTGEPVSPLKYFTGTARDHFWGVVGGMIWACGMTFSMIAFGVAGPAISYGLGQGATLVAALWGVFVWREFANAPPATRLPIALMFACYVGGLGLIIWAGA